MKPVTYKITIDENQPITSMSFVPAEDATSRMSGVVFMPEGPKPENHTEIMAFIEELKQENAKK